MGSRENVGLGPLMDNEKALPGQGSVRRIRWIGQEAG